MSREFVSMTFQANKKKNYHRVAQARKQNAQCLNMPNKLFGKTCKINHIQVVKCMVCQKRKKFSNQSYSPFGTPCAEHPVYLSVR